MHRSICDAKNWSRWWWNRWRRWKWSTWRKIRGKRRFICGRLNESDDEDDTEQMMTQVLIHNRVNQWTINSSLLSLHRVIGKMGLKVPIGWSRKGNHLTMQIIFKYVHNMRIMLHFNITSRGGLLIIIVNVSLQDLVQLYSHLSVLTRKMVYILGIYEEHKRKWVIGRSPKSAFHTHVRILILSNIIDNLTAKLLLI